MYAPFFGLRQPPFSIAPDPRYLFMSERHREALAHLLYGLDAGGGFVLLTGEIGTGKTTVCRCFLEQIPAHCNVAYIFNPKLTVGELLRTICDEFGVAHAPGASGAETVKDCVDPLNAFLLQAHAAGRSNVLIIDEAQNLSADVLEQLRLLTNLETAERKLLQIILIGQPELRAMLARPALEQLAQRVIARYHLDALSEEETRLYIAHRLAVAGLQGPVPFEPRALRRIHALAGGVPRRINLLCDRALLGAYARGARTVDAAIAARAAREVFGGAADAPARPAPRWAVAGAGVLAGAAAVAGAGWAAGWWAPVTPRVAAAANPAAGAAAPALRTAPATAGATIPAAAHEDGMAVFLAAQPRDDGAAWRALATAWNAAPPAAGADACAALSSQGIQCYRNRNTGLGLIFQLDRPGLLMLHGADGQAVPVLLRRLDGEQATLEGAGGRTLRIATDELARAWRGDYATLWRQPPGAPGTPAGNAWLDAQLPAEAAGGGVLRPPDAAQRRARILRFQLAQGLAPDGRAGPLTLMLLNRAAGVPEPRLRNGA
ncbi:AAA family ATPase [Ramlibacter sp. H39-3-26]|uniref:ExeA family protein n=1 Tax=Curvibacter soli TaxID=3031331 RepID=UPI0023D9FEF9|nr:AAA family ATPase [Ramlibacter sp. H39-3-26]MDF1485588.1 AAA family ATPase [Ramlibacter sp. H39-3-26]